MREHHAVPSIKRYVLVEQDGIALTVHARTGGGPWVATPFVEGDTLPSPEIGIEIPLAAIYDGIEFDEAPPNPG